MDTKTRPLHMLSTRDQPQNRGHIPTESEGLGKGSLEFRKGHLLVQRLIDGDY